MKLLLTIPVSAVLTLSLVSATQGGGKPAHADAPQAHHMAPAPVAAHQKLMQHAGTFIAHTKFAMGPDMPPMESTGEATFESTLGGRFLLQRETNSMAGAPFEALKMYGYNSDSGRYEGMWTYTGSDAFMILNGTSADGGKTIAFHAAYEGKDRKPSEFEITFTDVDADHFTTKLVDPASKATFETTYERKR